MEMWKKMPGGRELRRGGAPPRDRNGFVMVIEVAIQARHCQQQSAFA
jgi:hypothetical protein